MKPMDAIRKMKAPGEVRPKKSTKGVVQIHVTRACDKSCFNCTQGSNLRGPYYFMPADLFEEAVKSLRTYWGIVGLFGGNPALHPDFVTLCEILRAYIPKERLGLWCNNPMTEEKGRAMRKTFNPRVSNLNVHLDKEAFLRFKEWWPESRPFGLKDDSRHSPVFVSMEDLADLTEEEKWEAISRCEINQRWSASIGMFRGKLRAWFCEIAMAQSIINEHDSDYPDTGIDPLEKYCTEKEPFVPKLWWELPIEAFTKQIKQHCLNCGVPLRGYGSLAQAKDRQGVEVTSETYREVYLPKRPARKVQFVELRTELESKNLPFIEYIAGGKK